MFNPWFVCIYSENGSDDDDDDEQRLSAELHGCRICPGGRRLSQLSSASLPF